MDYKRDIQKVTQKPHLSFSELTETIVSLYGEEDTDGSATMEGSKMKTILNSLLGSDSQAIANAIINCPNASKVLRWYYDVNKGDGYICEK